MAQTWTATRIESKGLAGGTLPGTGMWTGLDILSCTGPATSVQAGAVVSVTSDLATYAQGAVIIGRKAGASFSTYHHEVITSTGHTVGVLKILTYRSSTHKRLSAAVSLTGETLYLARFSR